MKTEFASIYLLRGIAALLVCLFHFFCYWIPSGYLFEPSTLVYQIAQFGANGVFVFFVVSGFVIPLSLSKSNLRWASIPRFLSRRFVRIEIPYFASILLLIGLALYYAVSYQQPFQLEPMRILCHLFYLVPFTDYTWYNVIYWTLAIEFQFYIAMALLYLIFLRKGQVLIYTGLILFGSSALLTDDNRLLFHYAPIFVQGITLLMMKKERISVRSAWILIVAAAIGTGFNNGLEIAIFSFLTVLVIAFTDISVGRRLGEISYSLYLTHGFVGGNLLLLLFHHATTPFLKFAIILIAIMASLIFAYFFWRMIEKPSQGWSKRIRIEPTRQDDH
ncbi:MAG: hypothetical protein RL226_375 [Bacteroidota bacterium]